MTAAEGREEEKSSRFSVRGGCPDSSRNSKVVKVGDEVRIWRREKSPFPWFHWAVWQQKWGPPRFDGNCSGKVGN